MTHLTNQVRIKHSLLALQQGDITKQDVDAIVNAANSSLLGGGGVDGAIHRAAGPELLVETRTLDGCKTGDAKITKGYRLQARHIIHTVGPIYQQNNTLVQEQLASAYRRSLEVAEANNIRTIAFPSISTGAYGYPIEEAAAIALKTVIDYVNEHNVFECINFVFLTESGYETYSQALTTLVAHNEDQINPIKKGST